MSTGASTPPSPVRGRAQTISRTNELAEMLPRLPLATGNESEDTQCELGPGVQVMMAQVLLWGFPSQRQLSQTLLCGPVCGREAKPRMEANIGRIYISQLELLLPCGSWSPPERFRGTGRGEMLLVQNWTWVSERQPKCAGQALRVQKGCFPHKVTLPGPLFHLPSRLHLVKW